MTDSGPFTAWQAETRATLGGILGLPTSRVPLSPEYRGCVEHDGLAVEKWVLNSEEGSRLPAVVFRPKEPAEARMPGIVVTFGHGGSKSQPDYAYCAQVFAKLGFVCLMIDPIGEDERHAQGKVGTRAHDPECVHNRALAAGRLIMGKLVWDTMRGVDFMLQRTDVDPARVGVAGNSLGGAKAGWMAALDARLRFALVSGWAFAPMVETYGKFCTRVPNVRMREVATWPEYLSLAAPHCAVRILNGDADVVIDKDGRGEAWRDTDMAVRDAARRWAEFGRPDGITQWYERGGGHRHYEVRKPNLEWLVRELRPAGCTEARAHDLPEINFGDWCRVHGVELERLYGTPLHLLGATVVDLGLTPVRRDQLAVLRPDELGRPEFTIEGWLDRISPPDPPPG